MSWSVTVRAVPPVAVAASGGATARAMGGIAVAAPAQGPPGPAGASGEDAVRVAAEPVSALKVVSLDAAGAAYLPDIASADDGRRIDGIAITAATLGGTLSVRRLGVIADASWSWTPGAAIFCGAGGALTQTPPAGAFTRRMATALSATAILVQQEPLILAAS